MAPGTSPSKVLWHGDVLSVQARIRLIRSFDQRSHAYPGYVLRVVGECAGQVGEFTLALGKGAHAKHQFRIGDRLSGKAVAIENTEIETAQYYKVSGLTIKARGPVAASATAPFTGIPPALDVYRARGHRRLAALTYAARCRSCFWACEMPVELIVDQWDTSKNRYRRETFCYGPKSCPLYSAGPTRTVPGRNSMSWREEDSVDEEATGHRGEDE